MPVAKPLVLLPSLLVVYCKRSEKNDYFVAGSDRIAVFELYCGVGGPRSYTRCGGGQ